jgi:PilZ domain
MAAYQLYRADHPVTLRWTTDKGLRVVQHGRLQQITRSTMTIMLHRPLDDGDIPRNGHRVFAETREYRGLHLERIQGAVTYSSARLVEIQVDGTPKQVQRRRYLRSGVDRRFATAVLVRDDGRRYFLARPVDIGQGGIRFSHRLPLQAGDRVQLTLRLDRQRTITPTAEVIETWTQAAQATTPHPAPPTFVSRTSFVHLAHDEQAAIAQYVLKTLRRMQ